MSEILTKPHQIDPRMISESWQHVEVLAGARPRDGVPKDLYMYAQFTEGHLTAMYKVFDYSKGENNFELVYVGRSLDEAVQKYNEL